MTNRVKVLSLLGLVAILVTLILNQIMLDSPQEVPLAFRSGQSAEQTRAKKPHDLGMMIKPMRLSARESPPLPKRNLFASLQPMTTSSQRPKSPPTTPQATSSLPRVTTPPPVASAPIPQAPLPGPPPPSPEQLTQQQKQAQEEAHKQEVRRQLAQFRPLGFLTEKGEQRAFLGRDKEIFIIRAGDTLEGTVRVMGITKTEVILRETSTNIETTLSLAKPAGTTS